MLSVRHRSARHFLGVRERCEREPELLRQGAGFVLYALMDAVVDRYFPVIDGLESELEAVEEHIFDEGAARSSIERLYELKRKVIELEDALWDKMWQIHGMAHVWAARAVVPEMVARGEGYFVVTASAAGLLNIVESAPYGVTKHAAVAFAEWLRIAYGRRGVRVSCLCPQSVATDMTADGTGSAGVNGVLTAEQVAGDVVATMRDEKFLVLPHPEVAKYFLGKAQDYDRWLGGMQKLYALHTGGSA